MTNTEIKRTEKAMYAEIITILEEYENVDDLIALMNKKINQIETKAQKAKEKAAEKKAEADELQNVIADILTDEFVTIPEILNQIEGDEISAQKISARLKKLVDAGVAEKSEIKVAGGEGQKSRKLVAYRLASN